jgi:HEPN domain-containing protein
MKPHEEVKRRILGEWVRKAQADLAVAERLVSEEASFSNAVTFHCQQAAEKFIKAFLVWAEVDFPKTHDLTELLSRAAPVNAHLAADLRGATALTPYGVELRYPGDRPDATPAEAREAVELSRLVRDKVAPLLPELPGSG